VHITLKGVLKIDIFTAECVFASLSGILLLFEALIQEAGKLPHSVNSCKHNGGFVISGTNVTILVDEAAGENGSSWIAEFLSTWLLTLLHILSCDGKEVHCGVMCCKSDLLT